jgi:phenylacetate-CoA ligase
MTEHFDALETRDPGQRERDLMARLAAQIGHAKSAPYFAESLRHVDAAAVTSRAALAALPLLRKHELIALQKVARPFGGLAATPRTALARVYASPGPIYEPEGRGADPWRLARALFAAGFRAGDLIHNSFSYHMTPAAWMLEAAAKTLGCTVFPAGTGQSEQQVAAMADLLPDGYVGTPSFLRILLEKADTLGIATTSLKKALVSGEAFLPPVREALAARGIKCFQVYATADLGTIAYESAAGEGLIVDEDIIVEIVRPGSGDPVEEGEVGEVVVTTFNSDYPLIRFATGDMSATLPGASPCGRTNMRIKGWLGRADQTTKVRGMFVHPEQIQAVARRHSEIRRARLVVTNPDAGDVMTLRCEGSGGEGVALAVAESLRELTKLRGEVVFVASLPRDGKVIEDARDYGTGTT